MLELGSTLFTVATCALSVGRPVNLLTILWFDFCVESVKYATRNLRVGIGRVFGLNALLKLGVIALTLKDPIIDARPILVRPANTGTQH